MGLLNLCQHRLVLPGQGEHFLLPHSRDQTSSGVSEDLQDHSDDHSGGHPGQIRKHPFQVAERYVLVYKEGRMIVATKKITVTARATINTSFCRPKPPRCFFSRLWRKL